MIETNIGINLEDVKAPAPYKADLNGMYHNQMEEKASFIIKGNIESPMLPALLDGTKVSRSGILAYSACPSQWSGFRHYLSSQDFEGCHYETLHLEYCKFSRRARILWHRQCPCTSFKKQ